MTQSAKAASLAVGSILAALLASEPASAQTPGPLANWQYSIGDLLMPLKGPVPEWQTYLGAGAVAEPRFEGSQEYHAQPIPVIDVHYRDLAFLSLGEGLGVNVIRGKTYRAGVALAYDLGRDQHDARHLNGLGNISPAPEAKLFADVAVLPVILDLDLRRGIGGHDGYIGDIGAHVPIPVTSHLFLFAGPSITFADARYMQSYFSVSETQAAHSQFHRFDAHGGVKRAGFGLSGAYEISDHWLIASDAAAQRLLGDAARSPIVESKVEASIDMAVVYKF